MLKLCSFTKVKVFFLVLVYVFNFDWFEFSVAILEKGLLISTVLFTLFVLAKIIIPKKQDIIRWRLLVCVKFNV